MAFKPKPKPELAALQLPLPDLGSVCEDHDFAGRALGWRYCVTCGVRGFFWRRRR